MFGFNGKEKDNEIAGAGNSIHYEFREYDPRIGRFKSIDPRSPDYAWQSPYAYHRNSPISSFDYLGLGDPSTTAYHSTTAESGAKILQEGFKSGNSGWNYFMTDPSGTKAGSGVADAPVQLQTTINTEGAKTIKYDQWRGFFNEAKAEMGLSNVENAKLTTDQLKSLNAIRNQKAVQFMNQAGGDTFIIEAEAGKAGQKFIVMTDKAVQSKVVIQSISKGQEALLTQMEKTAVSSGTGFSRANVGSEMFRYGRMALRFAGETLLIEGVITAMQQKGEATKHYVERRSLNGHSPFYNWMMDTYSDVGLYDWYKYSIDLNKK
jgi:RHS repeat-associated protein